jgi:hypothetical protein
VDVEFHQLDLRYEALRKRSPRREARLLASLAEGGQQVPVVVVAGDGGRQVLVDGYKRVRALVRLRRDTVRAVAWDLAEAEALLLERLMRNADGNGALEEGRRAVRRERQRRRCRREVRCGGRKLRAQRLDPRARLGVGTLELAESLLLAREILGNVVLRASHPGTFRGGRTISELRAAASARAVLHRTHDDRGQPRRVIASVRQVMCRRLTRGARHARRSP